MINHNTVYILTKLKAIITIVISFFQINQSFKNHFYIGQCIIIVANIIISMLCKNHTEITWFKKRSCDYVFCDKYWIYTIFRNGIYLWPMGSHF